MKMSKCNNYFTKNDFINLILLKRMARIHRTPHLLS